MNCTGCIYRNLNTLKLNDYESFSQKSVFFLSKTEKENWISTNKFSLMFHFLFLNIFYNSTFYFVN